MLRLIFRLAMTIPQVLDTAKDAVYDFLLLHNIHDVHVEIVHYDLCFQPSLFAIEPIHLAVGIYECAKSKLVEHLDTNLSASWRVLCLFNVGRTEETAIPTVVVMVDPGIIFDFASLRQSITRFLRAATAIDVEFLPGGTSTLDPQPSGEQTKEDDPGVHFCNA